MTEDELLKWVLQLAAYLDITAYHPTPARVGKLDRWVTPFAGQKGFPDLVLVGVKKTIFAELKSAKGRLGPDQHTWLGRLSQSGQTVYVWRPSDRPEIERVLKEIR